jgi:hypothetical protein
MVKFLAVALLISVISTILLLRRLLENNKLMLEFAEVLKKKMNEINTNPVSGFDIELNDTKALLRENLAKYLADYMRFSSDIAADPEDRNAKRYQRTALKMVTKIRWILQNCRSLLEDTYPKGRN